MLVSPQKRTPLFKPYREIHFPLMEAPKACAASVGAKETLVHAVFISAGGRPIFLVDDNEKTFAF